MAPPDFGGDEEAALRYAIELSLQESGQPSRSSPIQLSSDGDDTDDLEKPPKYRPARKTDNADSDSKSADTSKVSLASTGMAPTFSSLGLDRKKMEEERLARLRKRKAPDTESDDLQPSQRAKTRATVGHTMQKVSAPSVQPVSMTTIISASSSSSGLQFPDGAVKRTWAFGYPRTDDDIKIEEIFQKRYLELAVLSSYQWDEEWLLSKIDTSRTKMILIAYAKDKQQEDEMRANVPQGIIRFCFPPMSPYGAMHSKLQLLKFSTHLRIVVPSGNLMSYDWGETGVMENMMFLIDLPRIEDEKQRATNTLTQFGEDLSYFLKAQGLEESLVKSLSNYDFTQTKKYAFVHSIAMSHTGDSWSRTGYCGLGRAVKNLGLDTKGALQVDMVVSSLGAIKRDLVSAIYQAAQGDDGRKELNERLGKPSKSKGTQSTAFTWQPFDKKLRIYFPTYDTVAQSKGSTNSGGTICAQSQWWQADTFPRQLIHDCKSVRKGLLMHSKLLLVRPEDPDATAWGYVGSANLSESAWGRLIKEKSGGLKLTCRNWECGVIVPTAASSLPSSDDDPDLSVFQHSIPVPMEIPGEAYGKSGSRRPWFFLENKS